MLAPLPEESQPEFAVRFHAAMAEILPATSQRNIACLNAWRKSSNHKHLTRSVGSRFPVTQYRRAKNVHYFEEHEVPEADLPDGTKVPPKKYSRTELAEMVNGMNARIADHEHFPPLSKGHTVLDDKGGIVQDPDVLGYTGPFYLGQVGDVNPRWGIFGDEYHSRDSVPELDRRRGRSPEVWPYQNARDRFFHPVAALGAEMPRGNLIPARYSRTSGNGEQVMVEFYMATAPSGGNTSVPSLGHAKDKETMSEAPAAPAAPEQYSALPASPATSAPAPAAPEQPGGGMDQSSVPELVQAIMQGVMETPLMQFVMQLYQEHQAKDSQTPMDGGAEFAAQAEAAPAAPAAAPPAPVAAPPVAPAPAPAPASAAPPSPPHQNQPKHYSRQIEELQQELATERQKANQERQARQRVERYSRLNELTNEFILDADEELERTISFSDDQFAEHCEVIAQRYARNPSNVPDFHALSNEPGDESDSGGSGKPTARGSLSQSDLDEIGRIAKEKGLKYGVARDMYVRDRREKVAVS